MFDGLQKGLKPGFFVMVVVGSEMFGATCRASEQEGRDGVRVVYTARKIRHKNMIEPAIMLLDSLGDASIIESSMLIVVFISSGRMMLSLGHSTSFCQGSVDDRESGLLYTHAFSITSKICKIVIVHRREHEDTVSSSFLHDSVCILFLADNDYNIQRVYTTLDLPCYQV